MTDSPMIRVLKYLEAGNDLILPPAAHRPKPYVVRFYRGQVRFIRLEEIHSPPQFWNNIEDLTTLYHWVEYLPVEPEKPALQQPVAHIRKVEL